MSFQRLPRKRGEKVNFFFENLSLVPETSYVKEHFKLVFGSGTSDLAKIRPLKNWTSWISWKSSLFENCSCLLSLQNCTFFCHIFGRSKSYRKALPLRCSSQLELSGTPSPISGLFYSRHGEKIHFQAQSACRNPSTKSLS